MRLGLFQCELTHPHQAAHLAMGLFATDLVAQGHEVDQAMVHPSALDRWCEQLVARAYDVVLVDSIFPFPLLLRARQAMGDGLLLVGGHDSLQHLLRGPSDLAVVGGGRAAVQELGRRLLAWEGLALDRSGDATASDQRAVTAEFAEAMAKVPNLWFRRRRERSNDTDNADVVDILVEVDCTSARSDATPSSEVRPFLPRLRWDYFGPARDADSDLYIPSIVAEMGCLYDAPANRNPALAEVRVRLPEVPLTPRAAARLQEEFIDRARGCSFCVFRYQPFRREPKADAIDLLVEQARFLVGQGARGLSLQTENPFPYLRPLLDRLDAEGIRLDELHCRTIPWLVLARDAELVASIARARELGTKLHLTQVGFESFSNADLQLFNKGLDASRNRAAAARLMELDREHRPAFSGLHGHGFILLHPWTTLATLRENLDAVRIDAPFLAAELGPDSRLQIYSEVTPLFWKGFDEGLLLRFDSEFGWGWRFAQPEVAELVEAWKAGLSWLHRSLAVASAGLLARRPDDAALAASVAARHRRLDQRVRPDLLDELLLATPLRSAWRDATERVLRRHLGDAVDRVKVRDPDGCTTEDDTAVRVQ